MDLLGKKARLFHTRSWMSPYPHNFKMMRIGDYDGSIDPEEHLGRFENAAMLHCYTDRIKCKVFCTTLVKSVQQWFNQLKPGSITSFESFSGMFLHQFTSRKRHKKTSLSLFDIRRKENESLRDFVKRFNSMVLEIPSCPTEVLISAFTQGLKGSDLFRSVVKAALSTYDDLLAQVEKYINVEETQ
ncbi:uncharacterized protein [Henckelia pumila]|uniref:uncharacterized protein n=1 Tax=Henckelia pumila TaxID=405737 RepID=UPI003C6E2C8A